MADTDNVRVLVLASTGQGGLACVGAFRKAGLRAEVCTSFFELLIGIKAGAGAVFLAEEALSGPSLDDLATWVARQPSWSDLPLVVLTSLEGHPAIAIWRQQLITRLRNVVLLQQPVQLTTLASLALSAIRSRRRQYETRAHVADESQADLALNSLPATRVRELEAANMALRSEIDERERAKASLDQRQRIGAAGQPTGDVAHAGGAAFGSWTLPQMDLAGATFAAQRAYGRVVTVRVEATRFPRPASVGGEVNCCCSLAHVGDTPVAVRITTWTCGCAGSGPQKPAEGVLTYVAPDDNNAARRLGRAP